MAEGDVAIVHGRFPGVGLPRNWIAADIVRIADGMLAEHWDVLQDEAARAESKSFCQYSVTASPVDLRASPRVACSED
jgi:predicted SnoaL-like aldol condensation-catalyzing enzyme